MGPIKNLKRKLRNAWVTLNAVSVNLWLDDVREAPKGWYWAVDCAEAEDVLSSFHINEMSLDHDLGACKRCIGSYCFNVRGCICSCHKTGYDFCLHMALTGLWPRFRPTVHSQNPVGIANMRAVIDRYGKYIKYFKIILS